MTRLLAGVALLALLTGSLVAEDKKKKPKKSFLGVQIAKTKDGVLIRAIIPKSPAEKAGLKTDDLLVRIDGVKPDTLRAAVDVIRNLKPGKEIKIVIKRDGKDKEIKVTPDELD